MSKHATNWLRNTQRWWTTLPWLYSEDMQKILGRSSIFEVCELGYVNDTQQIVDVYNACDVFVLPSLSENLPNTIMEAMACGVPSIGFKVGGIPEMIDHCKNGYVAAERNADDLAKGIHWVLNSPTTQPFQKQLWGKYCAVIHNVASQCNILKYIMRHSPIRISDYDHIFSSHYNL